MKGSKSSNSSEKYAGPFSLNSYQLLDISLATLGKYNILETAVIPSAIRFIPKILCGCYVLPISKLKQMIFFITYFRAGFEAKAFFASVQKNGHGGF